MTEHYIYKQYICHNHDEHEGQEYKLYGVYVYLAMLIYIYHFK